MAAVVVFVTFTGALAAIDSSRKGMGIAFSIISSAGIGYMEVITLAGGPLMVDPKDIGLACGVQFAVRTGMSSLADSIYVTIVRPQLPCPESKLTTPADQQTQNQHPQIRDACRPQSRPRTHLSPIPPRRHCKL